MRIRVDGVSVRLGSVPVLDSVSLDVPAGALVGIVGPNGSGKSTLLRTVYRALRPASGAVLLGEVDVWERPARDTALLRSVVPQQQDAAPALLVRDVVATGRHPHRRWFERETGSDRDAVQESLERCGASRLADRAYPTLSGGERQRVLLARALAQQAPVVLLDEPTNHLDPRAQLDLLDLLAELPLTRVVVLHDLDHAVGRADLLVVLDGGRVAAAGDPEAVLTPALAEAVFGIRLELVRHPITGRPHAVTASLHTSEKGRHR